jgi:orotidine-5'-phosphate decarboxylase
METMSEEAPLAVRQDARDRLIVALDFPSAGAALELVDALDGTCRWFKVGLELYYAAGNRVVETLRDRGFDVFLDLKLHDIPNTVAGGVRSAGRAGASLLNVHAAGGEAMMRAAVEAASGVNGLKLLAVTVLTSMDAAGLHSVGVPDGTAAQVMRLARMAMSAGMDGLVCSAGETQALRAELGPVPLLVTPGIRPPGAAVNDQSRVATPAEAIAWGASMLVVGRPITAAKEPGRIAAAILAEMDAAAKA